MTDLNINTTFGGATFDDWKALSDQFLKGKAFDTLIHVTEDGIIKGPLSTSQDRPENITPLFRNTPPLTDGRPWHIQAPVCDDNLSFANTQLLDDLKGGASSARLSLGKNGVPIRNANDLKRLFDQVHMELIPVSLTTHSEASVFELFSGYADAHINLGLSPETPELEALAAKAPKNWRLVTIDGASLHDEGATDVQELAFMATSLAYTFRKLGDLAPAHICVELATHQDAHTSIAKLRAARRIYSRIAESFGYEDSRLNLHVISSKRMMQTVDPWTNMLRVMSAGIGAVIGGADYITTRPFTDALGNATPFGYRVARNMQLMMMEESQLGHVQDAAYGSYHHENLTEQLAQKAWAEFQVIESEGGLDSLVAFKSRIQSAVQSRADRDDPILGVSLHPTDDNRKAEIRG